MKSMKKSILTITAASAILLCGCSSMGKFTADNFTVTPTPLEYVAGEVPTTISVNLPAKFMNKKAVVTCTPVLRWQGGEQAGASATFQGEKVEANHQIISYKNVSCHNEFNPFFLCFFNNSICNFKLVVFTNRITYFAASCFYKGISHSAADNHIINFIK